MRFTVFFLLLGILQVSAISSYSQQTRITINLSNVSVSDVLNEIENKSDFYFLYNQDLVNVNRKVSMNVEERGVESILDQLFDKTNVRYVIKDRQIILTNLDGENQVSQSLKVTGKVTDNTGQPLPGVTIVIKGTTNGTITNFDGVYNLTNVPGDATLVFSFVGMKTQEIEVAGKTLVDVMMTQDAIGLEEVVAIGYGVTKKSDLTGSVASVGAEAMERQSATNVTEILRGTLPGINSGISTSAKGASSLEIRGPTSLASSNSPLIVVDDVIYTGDIAYINPVDIEKVDVLKDASSAAIYGAKAASGVIIITTKKGTKLKPTINVRSTVGLAMANKMEEVYDVEGYLNYRADVLDRFDIESPLGYYSSI